MSMLLVPFFSPNDNPDSFTAMYRRILESADGDLVFSLLTKVTKVRYRYLLLIKCNTGSNERILLSANSKFTARLCW